MTSSMHANRTGTDVACALARQFRPDAAREVFTRDEQREAAHWRHPLRREAWRCGRLLAKRMLAKRRVGAWDTLGEACESDYEILSQTKPGKQSRPVVRLWGRQLDCSISISHASRFVAVALATEPGALVGIDLAGLAPVSRGFLSTWFTPREQSVLSGAPPERVWRYWTAKEAAYKASNRGEPFCPQRIEVIAESREEATCICECRFHTRQCRVAWRTVGDLIVAVALKVEAGHSDRPILLHWENIDD